MCSFSLSQVFLAVSLSEFLTSTLLSSLHLSDLSSSLLWQNVVRAVTLSSRSACNLICIQDFFAHTDGHTRASVWTIWQSMLGQRAAACVYLTLWGKAPSFTSFSTLFCLVLSLFISSDPPTQTVTLCSTFALLQVWHTHKYWDTIAVTYASYTARLDQHTRAANSWKGVVDLSVYACAGERGQSTSLPWQLIS